MSVRPSVWLVAAYNNYRKEWPLDLTFDMSKFSSNNSCRLKQQTFSLVCISYRKPLYMNGLDDSNVKRFADADDGTFQFFNLLPKDMYLL